MNEFLYNEKWTYGVTFNGVKEKNCNINENKTPSWERLVIWTDLDILDMALSAVWAATDWRPRSIPGWRGVYAGGFPLHNASASKCACSGTVATVFLSEATSNKSHSNVLCVTLFISPPFAVKLKKCFGDEEPSSDFPSIWAQVKNGWTECVTFSSSLTVLQNDKEYFTAVKVFF